MRKIEYVVSNERLITPSGLSLVGQVLGKSNLIKKANRMRTEKRSQPQIKNGDILLTMIGLLALGKSDFERIMLIQVFDQLMSSTTHDSPDTTELSFVSRP